MADLFEVPLALVSRRLRQLRGRHADPAPRCLAELAELLGSPKTYPDPAGLDLGVVARVDAARKRLAEQQAAFQRLSDMDDLPGMVEARDEARRDFVQAVELALRTIEGWAGTADIDAKLQDTRRQHQVAEAAQAAALDEVKAQPDLGAQAALEGGEDALTALAAVEAWRRHEETIAGASLQAATSEALRALKVEMSNETLFDQVAIGPESPDEDGDATLDGLRGRAECVLLAVAEQQQRQQELRAMSPCKHLVLAGRREVMSRASAIEAVREAVRLHAELVAEHQEHRAALQPEMKWKVISELSTAVEKHLDASDVLQDSILAVQRACARGRAVDGLREAVAVQKQAVRDAHGPLCLAMAALTDALRFFPELRLDSEVGRHVSCGLPQSLMPIFRLGWKLDHFDGRALLPSGSRHRVHRVTADGRAFAIKEYSAVGGPDGLRTCLREAALLVRAQHPHVVEVVAVFADPEEQALFIQMPFYEQGSLDMWLEDQQPCDLSVRRVLAQVVAALVHLHGLGIVHADVKPNNILIDEHGMARLGDLDISIASSTRTSSAHVQATIARFGFTPGFAAPEIAATGASVATDMYALGVTIALAMRESQECSQLVQRLRSKEPAMRPSAQEVLRDDFFRPVFAWAHEERRACSICLEQGIPLDSGIECAPPAGPTHFVCSPCLEKHAEATVLMEFRLRWESEGRLCCPGRPCAAGPYADSDLARHLSAGLFAKYSESRLKLLEQRRVAELEAEFEARLAAEIARLQAMDEHSRRVLTACKHIQEDVLVLKCPRCGQAFVDFDGCCALRCCRCSCGFCAWCGADSGSNDAHQHVRTCPAKPRGADPYFGRKEDVDAAQNVRRARLLENCLATLDESVREAVAREVRRHVMDLGLPDPSVRRLRTGVLFPGEGSQYVKMLSGIKDMPTVKDMIATANSALGYDLLGLCVEGPEAKLAEPSFCSPAMFVAGLAGLEKLRFERQEAVERCQVMAGLEVGEFTALCAAGVFTFADGLRLVKLRGEALTEAALVSKQRNISVAGLDKPKLLELCEAAAREEGNGAVCKITFELFPKGFTAAGAEASILALKEMCEKAGALQAKLLKVSGAWHTPLMAPVREELGKALDEMLPRMRSPKCEVYMTATATAVTPGTDPKEIVELLKRGVVSTVLWEPSVRAMIKAGVTEFYEVGPMKQIKAMMKRIDAKVWGTTTNVEV